ncbi:MAG: hypothetical protein KIT34_05140 [Cyanobacteria bacterium TGS_CYA1]|nr:hypothetical protein [Cyanobacteria bacterium TGS_CYA1]
MSYELLFTDEANSQLDKHETSKSLKVQYKAVIKSLRYLEENPQHPSLNTHKFSSLKGPEGCEVFEAYAQNNTSGAWRIFWSYYPKKKKTDLKGLITIISITPYP